MRIRMLVVFTTLFLVQDKAFSQGQLYQQIVGSNMRVDTATQSYGGYVEYLGYSNNVLEYPLVSPPNNGPVQLGVSKGWYYPVALVDAGIVGPYAVLTFYKPCTVTYVGASTAPGASSVVLGVLHYGSPGQTTVAGVNIPAALFSVAANVVYDDGSQTSQILIKRLP